MTLWLWSGVIGAILEEASARYPTETGGILMGYWVDETAVVGTGHVGPGSKALHRLDGFSPDHRWQVAEVARHYMDSGRTETYLGDWHSHPDHAGAHLSRKDLRTLRRIATDKAARASVPVMLVVIGAPGDWSVAAWVGRTSKGFLSRGIAAEAIEIRMDEA